MESSGDDAWTCGGNACTDISRPRDEHRRYGSHRCISRGNTVTDEYRFTTLALGNRRIDEMQHHSNLPAVVERMFSSCQV